ncbi:MAG: GNAT family N-acetyltransferase [Planctomycetota bacterium]
MTPVTGIHIRPATIDDVPLILTLIHELAEYERLTQEVRATEETLRATLFGPRPAADVLLAYVDAVPVGYALFFQNYSTFLSKPGLYLEDLYVRPSVRGRGVGRAMFKRLAEITVERGYGRAEWVVLDWNVEAKGFYERLGARHNTSWHPFCISAEGMHKLAE